MNTLITLENEFLKATFKTKGAELISLKKDNTEYIWQGNPDFWNRHAPILFPFIGAHKDNTYFYNNKTYTMGQHGFARDSNFKIVLQTKTSVVFELTADEISRKNYPFDFVLELKYTLSGYNLTTSYTVKNTSKLPLYFSIGGHPAFNCPFKSDQEREDYIIMFDNDAKPTSQLLEDGLMKNTFSDVFEQGGILELSNDIFNNGALVFNPNPFSQASFVHEPSGNTYMSVLFKGFPYLGIWSKNEESPFICIEPWHGLSDNIEHNKQLTEKEGIVTLKAHDFFNCEYTIFINNNHD